MRKVPTPIHVSATKAHPEQELEVTAEGRDERIRERWGPNLAEAIQSFVVLKQGRPNERTRAAEGSTRDQRQKEAGQQHEAQREKKSERRI